mmetsp:Transcript_82805/g.230924  ORF Transcript_82805/g.230924 Transcript_82805/m.230924 type:complete len:604 (+) Transcript_82805:73-1884(+)
MASSLVNNKYRITRRIGGGSFGEIYMGIGPNNEKVAVKFERHGTRCPQLRHEYKVYRELTNCHGFCSVYHFGTQDNYNVMVMDLLGPSLEDLFNKCNRRFSLKTVLQIADQMLERADTLHSRHLIHRDIKPANFVIGIGENAANIYCVDFGLSKRYRHPKNLHHIPHRDGRSLTGTPRYASVNNHLGIEQSRRDDLESIGYVLIYFLKGSLPWQGLKAKNAQKKYRLILEKKQQVSIAQLCQGCPSQFAEFLAYTRSLKFDAKPDIPYLRKLFRDLYHAQGCGSIPKLWDWENVDNDYLSAGGSAGGAAPPIAGGGAGAQPRPTTAAAVAAPGVGLESDLLMGGNGEAEDPYADVRAGTNRPITAGAAFNRNAAPQTGADPAQGAAWGYSRQTGGDPSGAGGVGKAEFGNESNQRRPHTAHGGRATGGIPEGGAEEGDAHVVAGARGMMRYRRNRATTLEGSNAGQPPNTGYAGDAARPSSGYGGASGTNNSEQWGSKGSGSQQHLRKQGSGGAGGMSSGGWNNYANDRPKSANTGANVGRTSGNWGASGQQQQQQQGNTLSYGSLKNRFLSGSGKNGNGGQTASQSGNSNGSNKNKLFSLAR